MSDGKFTSIEQWNAYERNMRSMGIKRIYIKVAGGWVAGAILSRLHYWESPSKDGAKQRRAGIKRDDATWVVRTRAEWCEDLYMTPGEFDTGIKALCKAGIIEAESHFFNRVKSLYLRIVPGPFLDAINAALTAADTKTPPKRSPRKSKSQDKHLQTKSLNNDLLPTKSLDSDLDASKSLNNDLKISSYSSVPTSSVGSRVSDETRASSPSASKNTTLAVAKDTPEPSAPIAPPAPPTTWDDVEAAPVEARRQARKWTDEHLDWYDALVRVTTGWTRVEFEGRKNERIQKRYHAAAKRLREAGYHTTDLISHYERGGWWWTDHWLGKERGEWPTVETIEDTWGDWLKSPIVVEAPAPKYPAYNPMPEDQRIPIPQTKPFWFLPGEIRAS